MDPNLVALRNQRVLRLPALLAVFTLGCSADPAPPAGDEPAAPLEELSNELLLSATAAQPIVVRSSHACAVLQGGTLKCWGGNLWGRLGLGDTANRGDGLNEMGNNLRTLSLGTGRTIKAVGLGFDHGCALLDNDQMKCWGVNESGQLGLSDTLNRGEQASQMGDNLPEVNLGFERSVKAVAAGSRHSCALLDNDQVKCWGDNSYGQLGVSDSVDRGSSPNSMGEYLPAVSLGTGRTAKSIVCGANHACALLDNNQVKCWGNGHAIGLGDINNRGDHRGEMGDNLPAVSLGGTAKSITAGYSHTCALLTTNQVKCWGSNGTGQLGLGDTNPRGDGPDEMGGALPVVDLGAGRTAKMISAGVGITCAVLDTDQVKCWGDNSHGKLGLGDTSNRGDEAGEMGDALPTVALGSGLTARAVSAGGPACVALKTNRVKCWGSNSIGQLGLGDTNPRGDVPNEMGDNLRLVDLGSRATKALSRGGSHSCALMNNDQIKCWGDNAYGQLGVGSTTDRGDGANEMGDNLPNVTLGTNRTAKTIVAGGYHACTLLSSNQVKCWGRNTAGQLGLGDTEHRGDDAGELGDALPAVGLGSGKTGKAIAAGGSHTCALLNDNQVKCWGDNAFGQLGLGDTIPRGDSPGQMGNALLPVNLGTGRTAKAIAAGDSHTCALLDTNQIKCWGYNAYGQLGLGHTSHRGDAANQMGSLPIVNLGTGRTAKAIAAAGHHTCALLDTDQIKCWGHNLSGQLGLGHTNHRGDGPSEMGNSLPAVDLGTGVFATAISLGLDHTCALLDNRHVKCWGANAAGMLGLGDTRARGAFAGEMGHALPAVPLGSDRSAISLSAGGSATCALLGTNEVKCWGNNSSGQLGLGNTLHRGDSPGEMGESLPAVDLGTDS
jgi:alpha-tubulin suppressor-like RCC1 family protein